MSSASSHTVAPTPLVVAHIPRTTNPVDDFFGLARTSSRTYDSRSEHDVPPSYVDAPEYTLRATEPVTLAMYLFKFGFCAYLVFAVLWASHSYYPRSVSAILDHGRDNPPVAAARTRTREHPRSMAP
jgi:hypothetical protein